jgi:hypothetical protein
VVSGQYLWQTELYGQAVSDQWSIYRKFGYYGQGQRSEVRETDRTTLIFWKPRGPPYCVLEKHIIRWNSRNRFRSRGIRYKVVHATMVEVDLYISAYNCLMADQTGTSQYVDRPLRRASSASCLISCHLVSAILRQVKKLLLNLVSKFSLLIIVL